MRRSSSESGTPREAFPRDGRNDANGIQRTVTAMALAPSGAAAWAALRRRQDATQRPTRPRRLRRTPKGSGGDDLPRRQGSDHPGGLQRRLRRRPPGSVLRRSAALHVLRAAARSADRGPADASVATDFRRRGVRGSRANPIKFEAARRARPAHHAPVDRAPARAPAGRPLGRPGAGDRLQGPHGVAAPRSLRAGSPSRGRGRDERAARARAGAAPAASPDGRVDVAGRSRRNGARPRVGGHPDAGRPRRDHAPRRRLVRSERFRPREPAAARHRPSRREE